MPLNPTNIESPDCNLHISSSNNFLAEESQPHPTHPMVTRSWNIIFKPKQIHVASKFPILEPVKPSCLTKALKIPEWKVVMSDKFTTFLANGTWTLVPKQNHFNMFGNKWVYRFNTDGSIACYKGFINVQGWWTILIHSTQSSSHRRSSWFYVSLNPNVGLLFKWMSIMSFFMEMLWRTYICLNHQHLFILSSLIMFASFKMHFMASNKLLEPGFMLWNNSWLVLDSQTPSLMHLYLFMLWSPTNR